MADGSGGVVAVFNSSEEVINLLKLVLEEEGFSVVSGHVPELKSGEQDISAFFEEHDPQVIVYDVSLPYQANWQFFQWVQRLGEEQGRRFVVTTTNKRALDELVGRTSAFELVGKPFDIDQIVAAVRRAMLPAAAGQ
ncbi:MAG TPA: response regulator [Dehalococcoidia bacterium]|nr:response regulator [Dehalococcoidia bacterium]